MERLNLLVALGFCLVVSFSSQAVSAGGSDSCSCPELACDTVCFSQEGITFYTEKCEAGKKVKSCARPTCIPLDPAPKSCKHAKNRIIEVKSGRAVASTPPKTRAIERQPIVGSVLSIKGGVWISNMLGKEALQKGMDVRESDTIETGKKGMVKLLFLDGNETFLQAGSKLKLTELPKTKTQKQKRTILNLIKGRVRNKVKRKYKGAEYFRVKTKTAVAGVRGTDFVVSYDSAEKVGDKFLTKVETLTGAVELASPDKEQSLKIAAGHSASYVVAANSSDVFSDDEINEFVARGYMTPVYKMTAKEVARLDWDTKFDRKGGIRNVAFVKKGKNICGAPSGKLNQCSWSCENNPKAADRCRSDLPQVSCVRRRCNANGKWAEDSRLPASFFDACEAAGTKVGPCDY